MGAWLSSVLSLEFILSQFLPTPLPIHRYSRQPDPRVLTAAARIAALHRQMEENQQEERQSSAQKQQHLRVLASDAESDIEDTNWDSDNDMSNKKKTPGSELSSDSDSDCPSPQEIRARQRELFVQQKRTVFAGLVHVSPSHREAVNRLQDEFRSYIGGAQASVMQTVMGRELGLGRSNPVDVIGNRTKAQLYNTLFPNRRKVVDKVSTKAFCCQFVKDGKELVAAYQDETIRFYQTSGKNRRYENTETIRVPYLGWSILDVALSDDGQLISYGTWRDSVMLGRRTENADDRSDGVEWHQLALPASDAALATYSIRFSRDGDEILAGASDRGLHVYDCHTLQNVVNITDAHEDDVNGVCYGDDGSHLLFSAGDDGLVKVWDRRAWRDADYSPVGVFAGHRDGVTYIDSRKDNRYLLSNSKDQSIKLWDLRKFSTSDAVSETRRSVSMQRWDYRWQPAPASALQNTQLAGDSSVMTLRGHSVLHTLIRAKFSPSCTGKRYIYTGCGRGEVVVYDMLTESVCKRLSSHKAVCRDVSWNPDGREIASCGWDGKTLVWRYDERANGGPLADEDSCDEFYDPIEKKRREKRRVMCKKRPRRHYDQPY